MSPQFDLPPVGGLGWTYGVENGTNRNVDPTYPFGQKMGDAGKVVTTENLRNVFSIEIIAFSASIDV